MMHCSSKQQRTLNNEIINGERNFESANNLNNANICTALPCVRDHACNYSDTKAREEGKGKEKEKRKTSARNRQTVTMIVVNLCPADTINCFLIEGDTN